MYFKSRTAAGQLLADELAQKHLDEPCTIVALSAGAVVVGMQIAQRLNCPIAMLLIEEITLPQEPIPIGGITHSGIFSYNHSYSDAQIEEFVMEYHGVIEQNKLEKLHRLHRQMANEEIISPALLQDRNVILVSDGLKGGFILDLAMSYLKPIKHGKIIMATPFSDVYAVDRMHILADELHCLNVVANYVSTDHYYDTYDSLTVSEATETITENLREWYALQSISDLESLKKTPDSSLSHGRVQPITSAA